MATRIYLPSTGAPRVSPAFDAAWDVNTGADRIRAVANLKSGTAMASKATAETSATAVNVLSRQYVVGPLAAGAISGTVKGQIRCQEANADADYRVQLSIRIVSADGNTFRGTLRAADAEALSSEFYTSLRNVKVPLASLVPQALTEQTAQAGDWLVIEIGYRSHNTHTTSRAGTLRYGDIAANDLAEDETTTADNNPWIEFSQTIPIQEIETRQVVAEVGHTILPEIRTRQVVAEIAWLSVASCFIDVPAGTVALAGLVPTISIVSGGTDVTITPSAGAASLAGLAPTLSAGVLLVPLTGAVILAGLTPSVGIAVTVVPTAGAMTLAGQTPSLAASANVTPTAGALTLAGNVPTINVTASTTVLPGAGILAFAGLAPTTQSGVTLTPAAGALTLDGLVPTVLIVTAVQPESGTLVLAGLAPTVQVGVTVQPDTGSLALAGRVPAVSAGVSLSPTTGALVAAGQVPAITCGVNILPLAGDLVLGGLNPVLRVDINLVPLAGFILLAAGVPIAIVIPYLLSPLYLEVDATWGILDVDATWGEVEPDMSTDTVNL